jgi:hypothetical protein
MSRKWIGGLVAVAAIGATALAASSVLGAGGSGDPRPAYATVHVDLSKQAPAAARRSADAKGKKKPKKPKVVYLQSPSPQPINPADAPAGVGPFIDVKLTGCSKVLDGGVVPSRTDVFVQGTYVKSAGEYHVLIGLDDAGLQNRTPFTITSNLTCIKGTK